MADLTEEQSEFIKAMTKRCKSFRGYMSNPQLCKGCNLPVQEHPEFMEYLENKKRDAILAAAAIELDPEEIIELTPTLKMKRSEFEMLRKVALAKETEKRIEEEEICEYKPSPPMSAGQIAAMNSVLGIAAHRKKKS